MNPDRLLDLAIEAAHFTNAALSLVVIYLLWVVLHTHRRQG